MYKKMSYASILLVVALSWGCISSKPAPIAALASDSPVKQSDEDRAEVIERQIETISNEILELESRLLRNWFIRNPGSVAVLESELGFMLDQRVLLALELAEAQARYGHYLQRVEEGVFDPSDVEALELSALPLIVALDTEIVALRVAHRIAKARTEAGLQDANAEINLLDIQIAELERERAVAWDASGRLLFSARLEASQIELVVLMEKLAMLNAEITEYEPRLEDMIGVSVERESIERRLLAKERRRETLEVRLGDMELE